MGKLGIFGEASNEKRNQRIIKLRNAFNDERINTVASCENVWLYG
ncbi:hypothetical protein [Ligilactobacillus acidipiscis]|nr:hypothetical protein [Ligilactobacillus acidipiscis]WEV56644.1 hypothetical protein OZX66_10525 [Ligilactobacillus acidipiscis]